MRFWRVESLIVWPASRAAIARPASVGLIQLGRSSDFAVVLERNGPVRNQHIQSLLRGALIGTQLAGLLIGRYILEIEPLASADRESLIAAYGPTFQRYAFGEIAGG